MVIRDGNVKARRGATDTPNPRHSATDTDTTNASTNTRRGATDTPIPHRSATDAGTTNACRGTTDTPILRRSATDTGTNTRHGATDTPIPRRSATDTDITNASTNTRRGATDTTNARHSTSAPLAKPKEATDDENSGSDSAESKAKGKGKNKHSKMIDLPKFYIKLWAPVFVPRWIELIGADPSPWAPSFDVLQGLQELRDEVYPNSDHPLDKKSDVYKIVSILLIPFVKSFLLRSPRCDNVLLNGAIYSVQLRLRSSPSILRTN